MLRKFKTIVAFNSTQVTLSVVSDRGGSGCLEYSAKNVYSGVGRKFFNEPAEIEGILRDFSDRTLSAIKKRPTELTLVLPQQFFRIQPYVSTRSVSGKVTERDVREMIKDDTDPIEGYAFVSELDGGYALDGQGDFTSSVVGKAASSCQHLTVYICLNSKIKELFNNIAKNMHVDFTFVAPCLPAVQKLHRDGAKNGLVLMISQLFSDIVYFEGSIPVSSLSIGFGSLHLPEALAQKENIPFEDAAALLSHVNLGLAYNSGNYVLSRGDDAIKYPIARINPPLIEATGKWAKEIRSATKGLIDDVKMPLYLVGSSIANIHGFNEIISQATELTAVTPQPDFSYWNSPEEYVLCALTETF